MLNKSKFGCVLRIDTNDVDPGVITSMTGIEAMLCVKGEPKINRKTRERILNSFYTENAWVYDCSVLGSEHDIEKPICEVLKMISTNEAFREVFQKFDRFFIRCYAYTQDYNIVFSLSNDTVALLQKVGIPIEFDLYALSK